MSRVGAELCVGGAERSRISKSEKGRVKWSRVTYKKSLNVCLSVRVCRATEPIGWRYIYIYMYILQRLGSHDCGVASWNLQGRLTSWKLN